ncbi:MAG: hypothetical protein HY361_04795 [Candidatus Aenigmarchaeota archaeon]|nr:hypothetical protein [Candidatus Aenigmarchaeota archaeon]
MTATDEMKEKLIKENEQLEAEIKEINDAKKPKEKQLDMNKKVLALINKKESGSGSTKRKYTKKSAEIKEA